MLSLLVMTALASVPSFGANPGALTMYEYVPANLPDGAPLVVVMHGCTMTAASMASAGWNALADAHGFAVLYPEQTTANNIQRCFDWFGAADLARATGENQSIVSMIDTEIATHHIDAHRVFVTGFSAGAGYTAVMLATWPDRFAAGAIMSGLPYRCATDVSGAFSCQNPGVTKSAAAWGDLVRAASSATTFPRVQIWQGASDTTVAPANATELVKQWTDVHGLDQHATVDESVGTAHHQRFGDAVELYAITGMSHAVVLGGADCPGTTAQYFEDHGICSTLIAARFFGVLDGATPQPTPGPGEDPPTPEQGGFGCNAGGGTTGLVFALGMLCAARRRMRIVLPFVALALASHTALASQTAVTSFGSNPGGLQMFEHIPAGLPAGAPLVVVLHGCTQTAAAMESAGWDALADQYHFAVAYAQQTSSNNPVECFNWAGNYGNTADLQRGMGENESIIQMVDTEIATHHVDTHRVYVVGFSAGAGFAAVMLATWPDRFAAGGIMAGLPYRCATDVAGAYQCQSPGVTKTPAAWGDLVRAASTMSTFPRVQIWAGSSDTTVAPMNEDELTKQWTNVWGTDQTADETETIGAATRKAYKVGSNVVVETYKVTGMSHAIAVGADPSGTCPSTTGQYFEDHGICATLRAARFFGLLGAITGGGGGGGGGADTTAPVVAFESPSAGDTVSGAVTVVVAASDDVGVASVSLAVDGAQVGTSTTAPYQFAWSAAGAGAHQLVATATDAAGNTATAMASVTVPGTGSGAGSGSNGEAGGGTQELPSCSLNAGGGSRGLIPLGLALAVALRRRRR